MHPLSIFIHSFRPFLWRPFKSSTTQRRSRLQQGYCVGVSRRSAQATAGKGLAQGPYMAARAVGSRTHDPPVESYRLNQGATMSHKRCRAASSLPSFASGTPSGWVGKAKDGHTAECAAPQHLLPSFNELDL